MAPFSLFLECFSRLVHIALRLFFICTIRRNVAVPYMSKESADRAENSFANSEHWYSFDTFIHQYNYPAMPGAPAKMD